MHDRSRRRPRDANQLAKAIIDIAIGDERDAPPVDERNPAAVALGRLGGLKGGRARAKALPAAERREIARRAAAARWGKKNKKKPS